MTKQDSFPEFRPLGVDGILVRFARTLTDEANARALLFRAQVKAASLGGVTEVASSLVSVKIGFDPSETTRQAVLDAVKALAAEPFSGDNAPRRLWRIPVAFGPSYSPQLPEVAAMMGVAQEQAVAELTQQTVRVLAIGFAPGQPYLGMLPEHWNVPRQASLTESLPRGALICAVRQLILWAADAPTGWRHIGQTAFKVYQPELAEPFAFRPGDKVTFDAVSDMEFEAIAADTATNGGAICEVLR